MNHSQQNQPILLISNNVQPQLITFPSQFIQTNNSTQMFQIIPMQQQQQQLQQQQPQPHQQLLIPVFLLPSQPNVIQAENGLPLTLLPQFRICQTNLNHQQQQQQQQQQHTPTNPDYA